MIISVFLVSGYPVLSQQDAIEEETAEEIAAATEAEAAAAAAAAEAAAAAAEAEAAAAAAAGAAPAPGIGAGDVGCYNSSNACFVRWRRWC